MGWSVSTGRPQELSLRDSWLPVGPSGECGWPILLVCGWGMERGKVWKWRSGPGRGGHEYWAKECGNRALCGRILAEKDSEFISAYFGPLPSQTLNHVLHRLPSQRPGQSQDRSCAPFSFHILFIPFPTFHLVWTLPGVKAPNEFWQKQTLGSSGSEKPPQRVSCWAVSLLLLKAKGSRLWD